MDYQIIRKPLILLTVEIIGAEVGESFIKSRFHTPMMRGPQFARDLAGNS